MSKKKDVLLSISDASTEIDSVTSLVAGAHALLATEDDSEPVARAADILEQVLARLGRLVEETHELRVRESMDQPMPDARPSRRRSSDRRLAKRVSPLFAVTAMYQNDTRLLRR